MCRGKSTHPSKTWGSLRHGLFRHDIHESFGGVWELRHEHRSRNPGENSTRARCDQQWHYSEFSFGDNRAVNRPTFSWRGWGGTPLRPAILLNPRPPGWSSTKSTDHCHLVSRIPSFQIFSFTLNEHSNLKIPQLQWSLSTERRDEKKFEFLERKMVMWH